MNFSDVIKDIKKLVDLELSSIRPGASITILKVDEDKDRLSLKTKRGKIKYRPLSELRRIWDELNRKPAVRVEDVLRGSGTSRNQPETILANLPYIEWLNINKKKHIAFVSNASHPYGKLQQMDSIKAATIAKSIKDKATEQFTQIFVVSSDVTATIERLSQIFPGAVSTIEKGVYLFDKPSLRILIIIESCVPLAPGSYLVIPKSQTSASKVIVILGEEYLVISETPEIKLLMHK